MTPDVSRAAAWVVNRMALEPDSPQFRELNAAADRARTIEDLPRWARTMLVLRDREADR